MFTYDESFIREQIETVWVGLFAYHNTYEMKFMRWRNESESLQHQLITPINEILKNTFSIQQNFLTFLQKEMAIFGK